MADSIILSPVMKSFLAGSLSGTCSTILFQPLDLVKTRLQTKAALPFRSESMLAVLGQVVKNDRFSGLWKGTSPSMLRCVPGVGLYFSSLHTMKEWAGEEAGTPPAPALAMGLGMAARTVSGVTMIPFTVVKTRYESGVYSYGGIREALVSIYHAEGRAGLTCGLGATLLRDAPFSGLYLMFYTQIKEFFEPERRNGAVHFGCGIAAGVMASGMTQPFDVVKTKMQLYPHKFRNTWQVFLYVHKKYGPAGFFKGLVPRSLRRTLMAAMAWTIYEEMTQQLQLK